LAHSLNFAFPKQQAPTPPCPHPQVCNDSAVIAFLGRSCSRAFRCEPAGGTTLCAALHAPGNLWAFASSWRCALSCVSSPPGCRHVVDLGAGALCNLRRGGGDSH
jgi:hypothetical protein